MNKKNLERKKKKISPLPNNPKDKLSVNGR